MKIGYYECNTPESVCKHIEKDKILHIVAVPNNTIMGISGVNYLVFCEVRD